VTDRHPTRHTAVANTVLANVAQVKTKYSDPQDPLAGFEGPTSKRGEGKGAGVRGEGRESG